MESNNKEQILISALEKIIEMNYQNAEDKYGDRNQAKGWACVTTAEEALKSYRHETN